jgi:hypothetical protein
MNDEGKERKGLPVTRTLLYPSLLSPVERVPEGVQGRRWRFVETQAGEWRVPPDLIQLPAGEETWTDEERIA